MIAILLAGIPHRLLKITLNLWCITSVSQNIICLTKPVPLRECAFSFLKFSIIAAILGDKLVSNSKPNLAAIAKNLPVISKSVVGKIITPLGSIAARIITFKTS